MFDIPHHEGISAGCVAAAAVLVCATTQLTPHHEGATSGPTFQTPKLPR
jgi:hypothetical protein